MTRTRAPALGKPIIKRPFRVQTPLAHGEQPVQGHPLSRGTEPEIQKIAQRIVPGQRIQCKHALTGDGDSLGQRPAEPGGFRIFRRKTEGLRNRAAAAAAAVSALLGGSRDSQPVGKLRRSRKPLEDPIGGKTKLFCPGGGVLSGDGVQTQLVQR